MASRFGIEDRNINGCGLFKIDKNCIALHPTQQVPIPLLNVSVDATIVHSLAQVEVTQFYINHESKPVQAIYYFPLSAEENVTHFKTEMEGGNIQVRACVFPIVLVTNLGYKFNMLKYTIPIKTFICNASTLLPHKILKLPII